MKIVFSYFDWKKPDPANWEQINLNMVRLSFYFAKKHGYETVLYVDKKNEYLFKSIPYDEVIILDQDILDSFPERIWSLGKILTFSLVEEPFCHIDFDLFIVENELQFFKNEEFFCFHRESWHWKSVFAQYDEITKKIDCLKDEFDTLIMHNCAMVGGKNFEKINQSAKFVIDLIIKEKDIFNEMTSRIRSNYPTWKISAYLEQIIFPNLCKKNLDLSTIPVIFSDTPEKENNRRFVFKKMKEKKLLHLWMEKSFYEERINNLFRIVN